VFVSGRKKRKMLEKTLFLPYNNKDIKRKKDIKVTRV